jgi:hypothetical protein
MTTGTLPFRGNTMMALMTCLATSTPTPPQRINPDVPAALSTLIEKLLFKDPTMRPRSAEEVADFLQELQGQANATVDAPRVGEPPLAPLPPSESPGIERPSPARKRRRKKVLLRASLGKVSCALSVTLAASMLCCVVPAAYFGFSIGDAWIDHVDDAPLVANADHKHLAPLVANADHKHLADKDGKGDEAKARKENVDAGTGNKKAPVPPADGGAAIDKKVPEQKADGGAATDKKVGPPIKASPFNGPWTARFIHKGDEQGTLKVVFEGDRFRISDEALKSPLVSQYKLTPVMVRKFRDSGGTRFPYEGILAVQGATREDWVDFEVRGANELILHCPPADFPEQCQGLRIEFKR